MRPVKYKPYHTFALRIPLEINDVDLDLFKWTTFLDYASLDEDSQVAPPYSNVGEPLIGTSSLDQYLQMGGKFQA